MKTGNRLQLNISITATLARAAVGTLTAFVLADPTDLSAAITGQWDFTSGNLTATTGVDLEFFDGVGGATDQQTVFGITTSLGLPDIGGQPAHVMGFPKALPTMGYVLHPNMQPNGGGAFVNQYTLIFDLLFPPASSTDWRALIQIDDPSNANDADLFINSSGGIGISSQYQGTVKSNTWHRLAFAVDLAAPAGPTLNKYLDGQFVGQQILGAGLDARWALSPAGGAFGETALLFTDENTDGAETQPGFVSSIQVHDVALPSVYLLALGPPTTDGIPTTVVVPASIVSQIPLANATNVNPESAIEVVLADGSTSLDTSSIMVKVNDQTLTRTVSSAGGQHTVRAALPKLAPRSQNTLTVEFTEPGLGPVRLASSFRMAAFLLDAELEHVFTNSLAAYWKLDEGLTNSSATLMLDVTGENHSVITAGLPDYWLGTADARFGGALHVDGENVYASIAPSASLDIGTNAISLSLWVKLEQLPTEVAGSYGSIYDSVGDEYVIYLDKGNKELRFKVTLANGQAARPGIPESKLKLGEWLHIVGWYDGRAQATCGEARIYLNGELMDVHVGHDGAPGTGLTGNVRSGQVAALGRPGAQDSNYYVGAIDDVSLWRQALTVDAIGYLSSGHVVPVVIVEPDPLTIVQHPQDKTALVGSRATFEVVRTGGVAPVTLQWKHNGANLEGATSARLNVRVDSAAAGAYTVVVQDAVRSMESNPGVLTVVTLPTDPAESLLWGLNAHWRLDDGLSDPNTQALADARGANPGYLFGGSAASWLAEPQARCGGALHVDGQNVYGIVTNSAVMDIRENQVSVALWARLEQLPSDLPGAYGAMYDSTGDSYVIYLDRGNQELRFKVTTEDSQAARPGIPQAELVLNEWIHVVGVYDGNASLDAGEARIYLNGVLKDTEGSAALTGLVLSGQIAGLGRNGAEAANFYTGALDDIGVWSRALTEAEVAYLASGQRIPSAAEPLIITRVALESGRIVIRWTGGKSPFQLQRRAAVTSGTWENVGATTSDTSASDALGAPAMFYRVVGSP